MIYIALAYETGRLAVMQYVADDNDAAIRATIAKLPEQPIEWRRISEDEAASIIAAMPRPAAQPKVSVAPVPDPHAAEIARLKQENADLIARQAALEQNFAAFRSALTEAVARHKAEGPAPRSSGACGPCR